MANSSTPAPIGVPISSPSLPSGSSSAPPTSPSSTANSRSSASVTPVGPAGPISDGPTSVSSTPSSASSLPSSSIPSTSSSSPSPLSSSGSSSSSSSIVSSSSSSSASSASASSASSATPTTLSQTSTSVFASTQLMTSDGHTVTSVVSVTTVLGPGTAITPASDSTGSSHSSPNIGAIVGGIVGGIAGLALLVIIIWALLRRKRIKDEFDGNFDPAYVSSTANGKSGGGGAALGGTLPNIALEDEDDGMGGRLNSGVEGGGIISPYSYTPGPQPSMSQVPSSSGHGHNGALMAGLGGGAVGAAAGGYLNEKRRSHPGEYTPYHAPGPSNASASGSGGASYYPGSVSGHGHVPPQSPDAAPVTPSDASYPHTANTTGTGSSYYPNSVNPYAPPIGRGPSPGPSAIGSGGSEHSSSGGGPYSGSMASGGAAALGGAALGGGGGVYNPRSAKEMEARGMRLANPDDSQLPPPQQQQQQQQYQGRQAYLQYGPGGTSVPQNPLPPALRPGQSFSAPSASSSAGPTRPSVEQRAGSAVIVHQDGGRVVMRKGERGGIEEGEEEEGPSEIPPTYDSLPSARPADG